MLNQHHVHITAIFPRPLLRGSYWDVCFIDHHVCEDHFGGDDICRWVHVSGCEFYLLVA